MRVLASDTDHLDFYDQGILQMESFKGSPVLVFINKRLFKATVRAKRHGWECRVLIFELNEVLPKEFPPILREKLYHFESPAIIQ